MLNGDRQPYPAFRASCAGRKARSWYRIIDTAAASPDDFQALGEAERHRKKNILPSLPLVALFSSRLLLITEKPMAA